MFLISHHTHSHHHRLNSSCRSPEIIPVQCSGFSQQFGALSLWHEHALVENLARDTRHVHQSHYIHIIPLYDSIIYPLYPVLIAFYSDYYPIPWQSAGNWTARGRCGSFSDLDHVIWMEQWDFTHMLHQSQENFWESMIYMIWKLSHAESSTWSWHKDDIRMGKDGKG